MWESLDIIWRSAITREWEDSVSISLSLSHYPFPYITPPDYCPPDTTTIDSPDGDPTLRLTIDWPEILYGKVQNVSCPCDFQLSSTALLATRNCGGNLITGADWERPNIQPCNFSVTTRQLCRLANVRSTLLIVNHHIKPILFHVFIFNFFIAIFFRITKRSW